MVRLVLGFCFVAVLVRSSVLGEEPVVGKQVEQEFAAKDGGKVPFLLYLPKEDSQGGSPRRLMLFLHGRGESDGPLSVVAKWGPPQMVARGESLPYVLVSPQCPREDNWSSPTQQARLMELLQAMIDRYKVDADHVYLTGLSMGGSGSWRMAVDHPERFAAVVPICGRGDVEFAGKLKEVPIWVFVGDQDRVFQASVDMVEAIRKAGGSNVRLTTLENIGHNSWSAAYASPDLYAWLGKQSLASRRQANAR